MIDDFKPAGGPAKSLRTDTQTEETKAQNLDSFQTPDEAAAKDDLVSANLSLPQTSHEAGQKNWRSKLNPKNWHFSWPPGKREWVASLIIIVFCGTVTGLILSHTNQKPAPAAAVKKTTKQKPKPAAPTTVASMLTGLQVDPTINQKPVTGVMIENSLDARPQSGLSDAGVVFEAIAEGGITRFLALFQDAAPGDIGPIRSARPYYIEWLLGFDATYAHVGGSPEALNDIKAWGVKDLDQFHNAGSYHRISSRAAPHNVYTGVNNLQQLASTKGWNSSAYTPLLRNKTSQPSKAPAAGRVIDITMSGPLYNVHYDYNPATNTYNRSEGGAPHMDANGSKQISPAVVVTLTVPYGIQSDGKHSDYKVNGSGQAYVFQDGKVNSVTWTKVDDKSQITFTDGAGKPFALNPGQTWITAVSATSKVTAGP